MSSPKWDDTESVGPSWDDTEEFDSSQKTNPLVSGVRQFAQGASANFSDELAGLVEGAGRAAGLNGLGGPMKDIGVSQDGPTLDWEIIKDAYKRARDKERASLAKDSKDNPVTSTVANLGGALTTAALPGMGVANISKLTAQGAAQGLGSSDADLTEGDVAGAAKDTAYGAGTGLLVGGALKKALPAASGLVKNTLEDVATAPMKQPSAQMGAVAKGLGLVGRAGDAFDNLTNSVTKGIAGTGNDATDSLLNQAAKKSSYMIPGVGKMIAAADSASAVPGIAQKGAQLALKAGDKVGKFANGLQDVTARGATSVAAKAPATVKTDSIIQKAQGTKYAGVLSDASQRGPEAVAAANFVLQSRDPEYRKLMLGEQDQAPEDPDNNGITD